MREKTAGPKEHKSQDLPFISSADVPAVSPAQKACNAVALQHPLLTTHSISSFCGLEEHLTRAHVVLTSHYLFLPSRAIYIAIVNSSFSNERPLDQENLNLRELLFRLILQREPIKISQKWLRANHRPCEWRVRQKWRAGGFCGDKQMNALK